jgi:hypothetical protein
LFEDWQDCGFRPSSYFTSYGSEILRAIFLTVLPSYLITRFRGYKTVPMQKIWSENLPDMHRIIHESFFVNPLFEELPYNEFIKLYGSLDSKYDLSPSYFLLSPEGKRIGFILSYLEEDYVILKSLAISKSMQGRGFSRALVYMSSAAGVKAGRKAGAAVLIRSGVRSDTMMLFYVRKLKLVTWLHHYQLMSYEL